MNADDMRGTDNSQTMKANSCPAIVGELNMMASVWFARQRSNPPCSTSPRSTSPKDLTGDNIDDSQKNGG